MAVPETMPIGLGEEGESLFELLRAALEAGEGFELFFVCSVNRNMLREIQRRLELGVIPGITPHVIGCAHPQELGHLLEDILALPRPQEGRYALCVRSDGKEDEVLAAWTQALILLNEQRNRLIGSFPSALVLMGPPALVIAAQNRAPDLWSVRSSVLVVPEVLPPVFGERYQASSAPWDNSVAAHELRDGEYYWDLAQALEGNRRKAEQISRANLLSRAADAWSMRGDLDKAQGALEESERVYRSQGDENGAHRAVREICRLHILRGDTTLALEILRNQVLPFFAASENEYECAEAFDLIADILPAKPW
ncbi:MAG: hypothetical protein HYV27_20435 [Candidatus Hydrogenedentes bacterium]|nr:hypothetical protein [Candidatus Hydrogenedentota bacterium]